MTLRSAEADVEAARATGVAPARVLVVRNDKLGDFTLALPSFQLLGRALPTTEVWALVPEYTRELAELAPGIDRVLLDPGPDDPAGSARGLARLLREQRFDALIALYSTTRVAWAAALARVPYRLGPATKVAQVFYNRRLRQARSRSEKPEYEYDLDLVRRYLHELGAAGAQDDLELRRPVLSVDADVVARRRAELCRELGLDASLPLVLVHPGHGGSANNLSPEQYAELLRALRSEHGHSVVLTAAPHEVDAARRLAGMLADLPNGVFESTRGIGPFLEVLACADLFVGTSTGPLHLAGALDVPTAGFYVRRRTSSPLRWQTLNSPERRLSWFPPEPAHERDMSAIDLAEAARQISARFL